MFTSSGMGDYQWLQYLMNSSVHSLFDEAIVNERNWWQLITTIREATGVLIKGPFH